MKNNYDNSSYDALSAQNWHGKPKLDALSQIHGMGTGTLTKEHSDLIAMQSGKANATEVMSAAEAKMSSDEVIMYAQQSMREFVRELMIQEESLPAAQLQMVQKAAEINAPAVQNAAAQGNGVEGAMMAGGIGLALTQKALSGIAEAYNNFCDKHDISPRVRKAGLLLMNIALILACAMPGIIPAISTAGAPIVEGDRVTPVSAQGQPTETETKQAPSTPTPFKTPVPTNSATPEATATEAEIKISAEMQELFTKNGIDMQFDGEKPLENFYCMAKLDTIRQVNFKVGDLQILRVVDCWYKDKSGKAQIVSLPVVMYNSTLDKYLIWGMGLQSGNPTSAYIDGTLEAVRKIWDSGNKGYAKVNFIIGDFSQQTAEFISFMETATKTQPNPSDKFSTDGDASEFPDKANASNFVTPSNVTFFVTK